MNCSNGTNESNTTNAAVSTASNDAQTPLMLPAVPSNPSATTGVPQATLRLDQLGPVIVNSDGTLARIDNWAALTDAEKRNIERLLVRRNCARLEALRAADNTKDT
ncbi:unnamed protein product [Pneumocystis jirovecii]|uniref:Uncharacterized protein n=2 Tax=Pneumocystis jirovecii TaxID=42068 RepID=L0PB29_PNEJI|nr:uncharacterized protein T551_01386 [Pneumocystis jirovecii RU7]KTW31314.1 hypothetical protein T551_01386 [Pneumocystis jirovecii RU7]CCJ29611.1 unnamed protein product [Pneumocystis jirovecii]